MQKPALEAMICSGFLCKGGGSCTDDFCSFEMLNATHYYNLLMSITEVMLHVCNSEELEDILLPVITKPSNWAKCFERRHVREIPPFLCRGCIENCNIGYRIIRH